MLSCVYAAIMPPCCSAVTLLRDVTLAAAIFCRRFTPLFSPRFLLIFITLKMPFSLLI